MALVEVMIGFAMAAVVMLGVAAYFNTQSQAMKGMRAVQARDNLITALARVAADPAALAASAVFPGAGTWPSNTGAGGLRDCWQGGGACASGTEVGFTLLDALGTNKIAGPGAAVDPRYNGVTAVYSIDGVLCGNSVDVVPDSKKCPMVVYTTFSPVCPPGYCGASAAQSLVIRFYIHQGNDAHLVTLASGRLRPYQESVTVLTSATDSSYPLSACPGGMSAMGGATRAQFCIETAAAGAQTLTNARSACLAKGSGYHLCSFYEWAMACNGALFGVAEEWVADPTGNGLWGAVAGAGAANCLRAGRLDLSTLPTRPFRCCVR